MKKLVLIRHILGNTKTLYGIIFKSALSIAILLLFTSPSYAKKTVVIYQAMECTTSDNGNDDCKVTAHTQDYDVDQVPSNSTSASGSDKPTGSGSGSSSSSTSSNTHNSTTQALNDFRNCKKSCEENISQQSNVSDSYESQCIQTAFVTAIRRCTTFIPGTQRVANAYGQEVSPLISTQVCCTSNPMVVQGLETINPSSPECMTYSPYSPKKAPNEMVCLDQTSNCHLFGELQCMSGFFMDPSGCVDSFLMGTPSTSSTTSKGQSLGGGISGKLTGLEGSLSGETSTSSSQSESWPSNNGDIARCRDEAEELSSNASSNYNQCMNRCYDDPSLPF